MIEDRGIDSNRFVVVPNICGKNLEHNQLKLLTSTLEQSEKDRALIMFVLDSLGMLSTTKEMEDTAEGKETRDMTRSQIVKSTFRVLTLKLGKANILSMIMASYL